MKTLLALCSLLACLCLEQLSEAKGAENEYLSQRLFSQPKVDLGSTVLHTFIFLVHGAADHWVPESFGNFRGKYVYADEVDINRIKLLALQCTNCNVVMLHSRLERKNTFLKDEPISLRVYSGSKKIFSRRSHALNFAEPALVSSLIQFCSELFPDSNLHLVYRGHSFLDAYFPNQEVTNARGVKIVAPYDYNFQDSPYGVDQFVEGLARTGKYLASITFAACKMNSDALRERLSPFTRRMIASDSLMIQCPITHGFNFEFLNQVGETDTVDEIAEKIASTVFNLHPIQEFPTKN